MTDMRRSTTLWIFPVPAATAAHIALFLTLGVGGLIPNATSICTAQEEIATSDSVAAAAVDPPTSSPRQTTVGMPDRIVDLILPGTELIVTPIQRDAPMVVRIVQSIPHGTDAFRYELEYYCLEPGEYNLADYLQRTDGTAAELPEISVQVSSLLGAGQVRPNALVSRPTPRVGGYQMMLIAGAIVWVLGLLALLFWGRARRTAEQQAARQVTLADRLEPLLQQAQSGELSGAQQADLERMLLTYWRNKLDLNDANASDAMAELKRHETAGQVLRQLETWLHMPADRRAPVDLGELLKPYRNVRAELQAQQARTKEAIG